MSEIRVTNVIGENGSSPVNFTQGINMSGIVTATSFVPTVGQLSHRNKVINGAMNICQRAVSENNISASGYYIADRFNINMVNVGSFRTNLFQSTQSPDGFNNSLGVSIGTGTAGAIASSERVSLEQRIESQNLQDLAFGTSAAKSFTLSFYVRSTRTGQYGINMRQHDSGKDYNEKFDISSANTWERKIITVTGNTGDTFADDNGIGLWFRIMLRAGSNSVGNVNYQSWGSSDDDKAPTGQQTTWGTDASDEFYLTGVQLEVGSVATPFEHKSEQEELLRCYRYYFKMGKLDYKGTHMAANEVYGIGMSDNDNTNIYCQINFPVPMREPPSTLDQAGASNYNVRRDTTQTCTGNPSLTSGSEFSFRVNFPKSSHGWGTGQMLWCMSAGSSSYLGFSAEL